MGFVEKVRFVRFSIPEHLDLIEPLTLLLHEAYAPLAAKGMKYLATHQTPSKTLERLQEGKSYLTFLADELVGTVTLYSENLASPCEYYRKAGVYSFGQFAVKVNLQGQGVGSSMMDMVEMRAKELGAKELALDTSEHASDLIQIYSKRGFKHVSYTQWGNTNYRSVVLSKLL